MDHTILRRQIARDLMCGLIRKGWILSHHATQMTEDLDVLLRENETLQSAVEDANFYRSHGGASL